LARREAGEPVQYITGRAAFGASTAVDRRVLIPRPETEWLVEAVLEFLGARGVSMRAARVLDLGTGTGCVALSIAHEHPSARVVATDASEGALDVARANAAANGLSSRVTFVHGDWFGALAADERFDVIVSNPPYIAAHEAGELPADVHGWEPHAALFAGEDGLDDLREIINEAPRHLVADGLLALELAEARATQVAGWFEGLATGVTWSPGRPRRSSARAARAPRARPRSRQHSGAKRAEFRPVVARDALPDERLQPPPRERTLVARGWTPKPGPRGRPSERSTSAHGPARATGRTTRSRGSRCWYHWGLTVSSPRACSGGERASYPRRSRPKGRTDPAPS
jgi:release factor glutamine methyltransferase